ncbi:uncharacterized protein N7511_008221 [Penicillium nucicola]|uniref:uncharacterized protein n=1 Tax=Penicillium nucicola TaxID=1850975 RepID=UPI0025455BB8|nr:uncharacterized protein N7511_008221 [Penicillium nucicola]KAJ5754068.1 hypothetical protein N7511_008221 [Penicillium nucicola]
METPFPVGMDSGDRSSRELGGPHMVVQQYARYPPTLESTLQSGSSLGSARSQLDVNNSPPLQRRETPRSLQSSPRGMRSAIPQSSTTRSGPSMSPPVFGPQRHQPTKDPADHADTRVLPSQNVTDETIDDAYVMFILYCNPNVPSTVDTSELRKTFRTPPRSDGKSFSVFALFELIRKKENGELKTWIELAIQLGVEPPSMEKKQSTQKVQQYSVRLKRWMRAMHVDGFFNYCLNLHHPYYTNLPPSGPFVSDSRDGVPLEEDLALRALVPQWKPKRGRKRAEDRELEEDKAAKRPSLDTTVGALQHGSFPAHSVTFPQSAIPFSAFPDDMESNDPWITAASSFQGGVSAQGTDQSNQDIRWRLPDREASPANYPQSAIIPRSHLPSDVLMSAEPRSAMTPLTGEKARTRRRHGPAVSSAWPSSSGISAGKGRGRPPNKGPTSGSFSTFQVNPSREASHIPNSGTHTSPPALDSNSSQPFETPPYNQTPTPITQGRPSKLQLQVPLHSGAPVRLATPPRLVVNGVNGAVISGAEAANGRQQHHTMENTNTGTISRMSSSGDPNNTNTASSPAMDDIVRALSAELIHARLIGRGLPLTHDETETLASAMVINLSTMYSHSQIDIHPSIMAFHLGVGHHFGFPGSSPGSMVVRIEHTTPNPDGSRDPAEINYSISHDHKTSGHFSMQITLGNLTDLESTSLTSGHHSIDNSNIVTNSNLDEDDDLGYPVSEATWKQRYLKLRAQMQKKDKALSNYKRKIVESVMADI